MKKQHTITLPKDLAELYGIFEGIDVPDKKELRRLFHEKNAEYILTRDIKDFKKSIVTAITPEELLAVLNKGIV